MEFREARVEDLTGLSALCLRSKAWWGYDEAFMALCVEPLTLQPEDLEGAATVVAWADDAPAGLAQITVERGTAELEKLFVDPPHFGSGLGRRLVGWAVETARAAGAAEMLILADPGAASFYERMGAEKVGEAPSDAIPGRMLPRMRLAL